MSTHGSTNGYTVIELLFVMSLAAIMAGMSIPQVTTGMERSRARAAARFVAARAAAARTEAVTRSATVALRFRADPAGVAFAMFVDGNRNGVRAADIDAGTDRQVDVQSRLEELFPGVRIAVPDAGGDPVQLGGSEILSFTPSGTATSGTIFVLGRDGSRYAVRVLGVTGRVRVLRFDVVSMQWVDTL